jgi:hypothetical protein
MQQRSVQAAIAAAVVLLSGAAIGYASNQPPYCGADFAASVPNIVLPGGGEVATDWKVDLQCLPLDPKTPKPCNFCLQAELYVYVGGQWVPAPDSSTGTGSTVATGYQLKCGSQAWKRWRYAWGAYQPGLYRMKFLSEICSDKPCGNCSVDDSEDKDFSL